MPKRVIDFDAMWGSDKLAACAEWAQAEYAWFYGLADASGSFELTNLRVIWGRVAAIRRNLTIERLEQVFVEFQDKGLLFVWEHEGKRYGHWTGSDVPGRLPAPSWRMRLERLAPPVPKQQLAEYVARFARGRATSPQGAWSELQGGLEEAPAQDWNLNRNWNMKMNGKQGVEEARHSASRGQVLPQERNTSQNLFSNINSNAEAEEQPATNRQTLRQGSDSIQTPILNRNSNSQNGERTAPGGQALQREHSPQTRFPDRDSNLEVGIPAADRAETARESVDRDVFVPTRSGGSNLESGGCPPEGGRFSAPVHAVTGYGASGFRSREKADLLARELLVGRGPSCGPVRVKPEALERIRLRNAARQGSRSP